jgi:hypothetical protein
VLELLYLDGSPSEMKITESIASGLKPPANYSHLHQNSPIQNFVNCLLCDVVSVFTWA